MWRIRRFYESILNLIRWFPVIWNDRDWDDYYIKKLLYTKIKHVRKYTEKRKFYVGWENEVKWMKMCEKLLDVHFNAWNDEYEKSTPSFNGTPEFYHNDNYGNKHAILEYKSEQLFWKILSWRINYWWD